MLGRVIARLMTAPTRSPPRWWLKLLIGSLLGLALAAATFEPYRRTWLRTAPRLSACARAAQRALFKPQLVSGVEPHETTTGATVYLTQPDDRAVRCASGASRALAGELAAAFAEVEPDRRAEALVDVVRRRGPSAEQDLAARMAHLFASAALSPISQELASDPQRLARVRALDAENEALHACRFWRGGECAARPRPPLVALGLGVPSALGLVAALGLGAHALGRKLASAWRRRRERRRALESQAS
jgi:hypothetical protein